MNPLDSDSICQCVSAEYAEDDWTCVSCGRKTEAGRLAELDSNVIEIYRGKLAKTLSSISSYPDLNSLSATEKKEIIGVIRMLEEMHELSPKFFQLFALEHKWARRLISRFGDCQCVGASYAEDTMTCQNCGNEHWTAFRVRELMIFVKTICREKHAETLSSIRSYEEFKQLSECERQEMIGVIDMLDEIRRLSLTQFRRFLLHSKLPRRLYKVSTQQPIHFMSQSYQETNYSRDEYRRVELHNLLTTKLSARLMHSIMDDEQIKGYLSEISRDPRALITVSGLPLNPPIDAEKDDDAKIDNEDEAESDSDSSESDADPSPPPPPDCCKGGRCFRHRLHGRKDSGTWVPGLEGNFKIYGDGSSAPRIELWASGERPHVRADAKRADITALMQRLRDEEEVQLRAIRLESQTEAVRLRQVVNRREAEMQRLKRQSDADIARLIEEKSESDKDRLDANRALEQKESEIEALRVDNQRIAQELRRLRTEKDVETARLHRLIDEMKEQMQSQHQRSVADKVELKTQYDDLVEGIKQQQLKKMQRLNQENERHRIEVEEMERKCSAMEQEYRAEEEQMARAKCELVTKTAEVMNRQSAENRSLRAMLAKISQRRKR